MKLISLSVANFGKLHDYDLTLTDGLNTISNATVASMKRCGIKQVIVVGGAKGAVSDKVVSKLRNNGITMMKRLWGQTHYDTSRAIANWGIGHGILLCLLWVLGPLAVALVANFAKNASSSRTLKAADAARQAR